MNRLVGISSEVDVGLDLEKNPFPGEFNDSTTQCQLELSTELILSVE